MPLPAESGCAGSKYRALTIDSNFRPDNLPLGEDCDGHCGRETCLVLTMTSQYMLPRTAYLSLMSHFKVAWMCILQSSSTRRDLRVSGFMGPKVG